MRYLLELNYRSAGIHYSADATIDALDDRHAEVLAAQWGNRKLQERRVYAGNWCVMELADGTLQKSGPLYYLGRLIGAYYLVQTPISLKAHFTEP